MSESTIATAPIEGLPEPKEPEGFILDVSIKGLPYVFEGVAPKKPQKFEFAVSLPEPEWHTIAPKIEELVERDLHFRTGYENLQQTLHLGDGRVGSVWVSGLIGEGVASGIVVNRIQTDNRYLPEESEYNNASGVGSFILDNLCTLADLRGWNIHLNPLSHGKLGQAELYEWYAKRGFKDGGDLGESTRESRDRILRGYDMVRFPVKPDMAQPIAQALDKK